MGLPLVIWTLSFDLWQQKSVKIRKKYHTLWTWLSDYTVFRCFCSICAFRRQKWIHEEPIKTIFLKFFTIWRFFISVAGLNYHFLYTSFLWNFKNSFFSQNFGKNGNFGQRNVDKTENVKNNEIKILVWPPESLKSRKIVFSDNHGHK